MVPTQHLYQILKTFMDITSGSTKWSVWCWWRYTVQCTVQLMTDKNKSKKVWCNPTLQSGFTCNITTQNKMQLSNFLSHTIAKQWTNNLLAELHFIVHSYSQHGVVAANLTSQCCTSFKNIYSAGSTIIASVIVDIVETDRKHLLVCVQCFCTYQLACSSPSHQPANNLIISILR